MTPTQELYDRLDRLVHHIVHDGNSHWGDYSPVGMAWESLRKHRLFATENCIMAKAKVDD